MSSPRDAFWLPFLNFLFYFAKGQILAVEVKIAFSRVSFDLVSRASLPLCVIEEGES